jgi:hypothetical protein
VDALPLTFLPAAAALPATVPAAGSSAGAPAHAGVDASFAAALDALAEGIFGSVEEPDADAAEAGDDAAAIDPTSVPFSLPSLLPVPLPDAVQPDVKSGWTVGSQGSQEGQAKTATCSDEAKADWNASEPPTDAASVFAGFVAAPIDRTPHAVAAIRHDSSARGDDNRSQPPGGAPTTPAPAGGQPSSEPPASASTRAPAAANAVNPAPSPAGRPAGAGAPAEPRGDVQRLDAAHGSAREAAETGPQASVAPDVAGTFDVHAGDGASGRDSSDGRAAAEARTGDGRNASQRLPKTAQLAADTPAMGAAVSDAAHRLSVSQPSEHAKVPMAQDTALLEAPVNSRPVVLPEVSQYVPRATTLSAPAMPSNLHGREVAADVLSGTSRLPGETTSQIVQSLRLLFSRNGGEAHIRLEPRQFGDLSVSLRVEGRQVTARVEADTPVVREWLHTNQSVLRSGLAEHQLTLGRIEVAEPSESRDPEAREREHSREERRQPPRRNPPVDDDERFQIVV